MKAILIRHDRTPFYTLGTLIVQAGNMREVEIDTLELPWKMNQRNISCIPEGVYQAEKYESEKHGKCFHVKDVENRTGILIHPANFVRELRGCIAPGLSHADIDQDGIIDVTSSRKAMDILLEKLPDKFELEVR